MKEPISSIYNCDCLEYMKTLPDKFYDLILADPPYGDALPGDRDVDEEIERKLERLKERMEASDEQGKDI